MEDFRKKRFKLIWIIIGAVMATGIILVLLLRSCDRNQNNMVNSRTSEGASTTFDDGRENDEMPFAVKQDSEKSGEKEGKEESSSEPDSTTAADDETKKTEKESEKETPSKESAKETIKASETTKESTTAKEPETQKPTEPTTPASTTASTEPATTAHTHNWVEVTKTVHHDAVTHIVHHDAVYETVTVPEQGHWEETTTKVEVEPAWDEVIQEQHDFCNTCGVDLDVLWKQAGSPGDPNDFIIQHMEENDHTGWHTDMATVQTIHHDAIYKDQTTKTWVVDAPAHDEQKLVSEAWDETVVDQAAYDEIVITGYKCSGCGATK